MGSGGNPFTHSFDFSLSACFFFVLFVFIFKIFWPCCTACGILVPRPGIEAAPPAVEAWSLNHWTTGEVPEHLFDVRLEPGWYWVYKKEQDSLPALKAPVQQQQQQQQQQQDWIGVNSLGLGRGDFLKEMTSELGRSSPGRGGEEEEGWLRQQEPWVPMPKIGRAHV